MTAQFLWDKFTSEYDWRKDMFNAVIEQMGGVDFDNLQSLHDVKNGLDGYTGFNYANEYKEFWSENRETIMKDMAEMADDIYGNGMDEWGFVKSFSVYNKQKGKSDLPKNKDLACALYGNIEECEDMSLLAYLCAYALEEAAYYWHEWCYDNDIDVYDLNEEEYEDEGNAGVSE